MNHNNITKLLSQWIVGFPTLFFAMILQDQHKAYVQEVIFTMTSFHFSQSSHPHGSWGSFMQYLVKVNSTHSNRPNLAVTTVMATLQLQSSALPHAISLVPYSGKFSRGPNFRDFHDPRPKRENKNREIDLNTRTFA